MLWNLIHYLVHKNLILAVSWPRSILYTLYHLISLTRILVFSSQLHWTLPSGTFPSSLPPKTIRVTWPAYRTLIHLVTLLNHSTIPLVTQLLCHNIKHKYYNFSGHKASSRLHCNFILTCLWYQIPFPLYC